VPVLIFFFLERAMRYRGYVIQHDPPPIPNRSHDWQFAHEDYDGAPDSGDHRIGTAPSLEEAKAGIDEQIAELTD
jgi:hypothetical protein